MIRWNILHDIFFVFVFFENLHQTLLLQGIQCNLSVVFEASRLFPEKIFERVQRVQHTAHWERFPRHWEACAKLGWQTMTRQILAHFPCTFHAAWVAWTEGSKNSQNNGQLDIPEHWCFIGEHFIRHLFKGQKMLPFFIIKVRIKTKPKACYRSRSKKILWYSCSLFAIFLFQSTY